MKSIIVFVFLVSLKLSANGQQSFRIDEEKSSYAVIKDIDGFVNVRKAPNNTAQIVGKIKKYDIFMVEPDKTDWWKVEQVQHNNGYETDFLDGYVHKSRISILPAGKSKNIKPIFADSYTFKIDDFLIVINKAAFHPKEHKLLNKGQDKLFIDGRGFWGTDGTVPKEVLASIKISKNGNLIAIPAIAYNDLYEPHLETLSILYGPENTFYLLMNNSDGAGGYTVVWGFKDDKYYNRYVDDSLD